MDGPCPGRLTCPSPLDGRPGKIGGVSNSGRFGMTGPRTPPMQLNPYQPQDPAAGANGDRIPVPTQPPGPAEPPSLLAVFAREVRKRKKMALVWAVVTALVTGVVVFQVAKPLYRAEGKYAYLPNYRASRGMSIYTPPNIQ